MKKLRFDYPGDDGIRPRDDDFEALQDYLSAIEAIYQQFEKGFVVAGCVIEGDKVNAGIVFLEGQLRGFAEVIGVDLSTPKYIVKGEDTLESPRPLVLGAPYDRFNRKSAQLVDTAPNTGDYIEITSSGLPFRFVDFYNQINNRLAGHDSTISTINGRLDDHDSDIGGINGRLDGHDSTIITINGRLDGHDSSITTINNKITTNITDLSAVNGRLDGHDSDISGINGRLDGLDNSITSINGTLNSHGSSITSINTTLGQHDTRIINLDSEVQNINNRLVSLSSVITLSLVSGWEGNAYAKRDALGFIHFFGHITPPENILDTANNSNRTPHHFATLPRVDGESDYAPASTEKHYPVLRREIVSGKPQTSIVMLTIDRGGLCYITNAGEFLHTHDPSSDFIYLDGVYYHRP